MEKGCRGGQDSGEQQHESHGDRDVDSEGVAAADAGPRQQLFGAAHPVVRAGKEADEEKEAVERSAGGFAARDARAGGDHGMRLLWTDPIGTKCLTYAIISEAIGILVIRRIANIRV